MSKPNRRKFLAAGAGCALAIGAAYLLKDELYSLVVSTVSRETVINSAPASDVTPALSPTSSPASTESSTKGQTPAKPAPDFTLPVVGPSGLTGKTVSLSSYREKVVLLEFMAPWCVHCQNMAPILENLYSKYGSDRIDFLSVSGSWRGATADDVAKFIRDYKSSWTYAYDSSNKAPNVYGVRATPTFFTIAKDGSIADTYTGEVSFETLAGDLNRLTA